MSFPTKCIPIKDKSEQHCLSCSLSSFKQRSTWMGTACARLNVVLCLFLGEQQLLPHDGMNVHEQDCFRWVFLFNARTSRFHQEPCTLMKWQAVAEMTASHHDRPLSTEYGKLTKKILIENTNIFGYFLLVLLFPAGKIKFRGLRQKPSLQIKAICFTLLSCKRHRCRRSSCATGLHNDCNLQFHESVNPKTCKGSVEVVQLLYGVAALSTSSSPPHESEKKVK